MAHGGGTYTVQNKILGGAYFKFTSIPQATATIADRGVSAIALGLSWGDGENVRKVEAGEFLTNSLKLFGYDYSDPKMFALRELFLHTKEAYIYRLDGSGTKATSNNAEAKYAGTRGNDLRYVIEVDDEDVYTVTHYLGNRKLNSQIVTSASELVDDDFIIWDKEEQLVATAGINLTGGTDSTITTAEHQAFLDKMERYSDTNSIGFYVPNTDNLSTVNTLYATWAKYMRDDVGLRLQAVLSGYAGDNYTIVNVNSENGYDCIPWVIGVNAGTEVNKSATNMTYDGEATINVDFTQKELEDAIKAGKFTFHAVGDEIRVLEDINSFVSITDEQGEIFCDNQTIRVIDTYADAVGTVFNNKYHGKVPNDVNGRISLWSDVIKVLNQLRDIRAIEPFDSKEITVNQGDSKKSVLVNATYSVINTMVRLYTNTVIS